MDESTGIWLALKEGPSSRRRVFTSRRPIGTPLASEFADHFGNERIRLGFAHLVDPQLADEHVHDLRAVDPAPLGKVVRLTHRVVHAMDSNSVVLDVVPHTDPFACGDNRALAGCQSRLNLGKVVRLTHRVVHAMDSNSVVLDVVPHTDPFACGDNRALAGCQSRLNLGTVPKLRRCGGGQQPKPSLYPSVLRRYSRSRSAHRPRRAAQRACERT